MRENSPIHHAGNTQHKLQPIRVEITMQFLAGYCLPNVAYDLPIISWFMLVTMVACERCCLNGWSSCVLSQCRLTRVCWFVRSLRSFCSLEKCKPDLDEIWHKCSALHGCSNRKKVTHDLFLDLNAPATAMTT